MRFKPIKEGIFYNSHSQLCTLDTQWSMINTLEVLSIKVQVGYNKTMIAQIIEKATCGILNKLQAAELLCCNSS